MTERAGPITPSDRIGGAIHSVGRPYLELSCSAITPA